MAIKTSRWTFAKKSPMACFTPIVGATVTRVKRCEAASFLYVLIELLNEKGILTVEELGERKRVGRQRLTKEFKEKSMGAMLHNPEYDKYFFDCRNDQRIWLDFENMIVNPDIGRENWPQYVLQKEGQKNNP